LFLAPLPLCPSAPHNRSTTRRAGTSGKRQRREENIYDLLEQAPFINSGSFVEVQQKSLAFKLKVQDEEAEMMYVREECKLLWETLNKAVEHKQNLSVNGPPGTGKSTEVWAWALWHAKTKGA
jgi:predicted PilT family ATPase